MAVGAGHAINTSSRRCERCSASLMDLFIKPDLPCALGLWPVSVAVPLRKLPRRG